MLAIMWEVKKMGVQACACQGSIITNGTYDFILFSVDYDILMNICPDCGLEDSEVNIEMVFSSTFPALNFTLTFDGGPVGLPTCDGETLSVTLSGTLDIDGTSEVVVIPIVLDQGNQQICVTLPQPVPIFGDQICLPAPVVVTPCV